MRLLLAMTASLALLAGPRARADGAPAPAERGASYALQVLGADALAFGLVAGGIYGGARADSAALGFGVAVPGGLLYLAGAPALHHLHGRDDDARRSALTRLLLPTGVGAFSAGTAALLVGDGGSHEVCGRACAAALVGAGGFALGMLGASVWDWSGARERPAASAAAGHGAPSWEVAPALLPLRGGGGLAVVGGF
jgi:hypothetical protein